MTTTKDAELPVGKYLLTFTRDTEPVPVHKSLESLDEICAALDGRRLHCTDKSGITSYISYVQRQSRWQIGSDLVMNEYNDEISPSATKGTNMTGRYRTVVAQDGATNESLVAKLRDFYGCEPEIQTAGTDTSLDLRDFTLFALKYAPINE